MGAVANEWDEYAKSWDTDHATRAYAASAFASLRRVTADFHLSLDGARVLDFGCGSGILTEHLVAAGSEVFAVDTSPAMLDVLEAKIAQRDWTSVCASDSLPAEHSSFDLVVCSSVCAFLDDYPAAVGELVTYLRGQGLFVQWDWERQGEEPHGLSRTEIQEALTAAGLSDISVSEAFSVTVEDQTMSPIMGVGQRPRRQRGHQSAKEKM